MKSGSKPSGNSAQNSPGVTSGPVPDFARPEDVSRRIENAKKIVSSISGGRKTGTFTFKISPAAPPKKQYSR